MKKTLKITDAKYIEGYKIELSFNNSTAQTVDFENVLFSNSKFAKYTILANFKQFNLDCGNIVWGEDWDLIFPINQLHENKLKISNAKKKTI